MSRSRALAVAAALLLTGCSSPSVLGPASPSASPRQASPSSTPSPTSTIGAGTKVCEVTDELGAADLGVNAGAWQGIERAHGQLGVQSALFESGSESDYSRNLKKAMDSDCDLIVTVGFLMADTTTSAASRNRTQKFTIIDPELPKDAKPKGQLLQQTFATRQAAFLAGYLAAGMTKTGRVGTFGGVPVAATLQMMDGFRNGVLRYNKDKGVKVEVLGWNGVTGRFTNDFYDTAKAAAVTTALLDKGADIVLAAAGVAGTGAAQVAVEVGTDRLKIIGTDFDQFVADPANSAAYLTSIMKNVDITTTLAIDQVVDGTFTKGVLAGTLENGGVGLAPFHDFEGDVPPALLADLTEVRASVVSGKIKVD